MSVDEAKPKVTPRDIALILGAVVAVVVAIAVIAKTVNANKVHDVIVIKGAKGAKPMGDELKAQQAIDNPAAGSDASDRVLQKQ